MCLGPSELGHTRTVLAELPLVPSVFQLVAYLLFMVYLDTVDNSLCDSGIANAMFMLFLSPTRLGRFSKAIIEGDLSIVFGYVHHLQRACRALHSTGPVRSTPRPIRHLTGWLILSGPHS